jgi:ATP-dependent Clp protease ATP-binding subunit ClpA
VNGYNFTVDVRRALQFAREQAAHLQHQYVGTEHILLALVHDATGPTAGVFDRLRVNREAIAGTVVDTVKKGPSGPVPHRDARGEPYDLPFTSRAKKVLELAMGEARNTNDSYVGTEHLLVGLVAEAKGIAAQILAHSGVTLAEARKAVHDIGGRPAPLEAMPPARTLTIALSSQRVAKERGCDSVAPEHFVLALLREEKGRANAVLSLIGADRPRLLEEIDAIAPRGDAPDRAVTHPLPPTDLFLRVLAQKRSPGRPEGSTDEMLLAVLDHHEPVAALFARHGITAAALRRVLRDIDE